MKYEYLVTFLDRGLVRCLDRFRAQVTGLSEACTGKLYVRQSNNHLTVQNATSCRTIFVDEDQVHIAAEKMKTKLELSLDSHGFGSN